MESISNNWINERFLHSVSRWMEFGKTWFGKWLISTERPGKQKKVPLENSSQQVVVEQIKAMCEAYVQTRKYFALATVHACN